jgi:hypothetical protein
MMSSPLPLARLCKASALLGLLQVATTVFPASRSYISVQASDSAAVTSHATDAMPNAYRNAISLIGRHKTCLFGELEAQTPISTRDSIDRGGGCHGCPVEENCRQPPASLPDRLQCHYCCLYAAVLHYCFLLSTGNVMRIGSFPLRRKLYTRLFLDVEGHSLRTELSQTCHCHRKRGEHP